jgi:KUP system potassium uptake protein
MTTSFFLSRETLIPSKRPTMGPLGERLFVALSATAQSATHYYRLPPNRVVELGAQIQI